jgi:predicted DNA-binding protein (UPF0251 family)
MLGEQIGQRVRCPPSAITRILPRMNALATIPDAEQSKTEKPIRISKRLQEAIRLLSEPECKTQRAAAHKLGMSETYLCEALKKPEIQVFIARAARQTMASGLLRASKRVMELVDAGSEHVSLDASKHVLAIGGIKPPADAQVSVNIDIKAGYVIDISEGQARPMVDVSPTTLAHD